LFEPQFRRNFVHVRDIARAFIHAINHQNIMKENVYNVGDTRANMTKKQLCEIIKRSVPDFEIFETNSKADPDKRDYLVSNAKIEATGWFPLYTIYNGIRELTKFYSSIKRFNMGNV
jgi:nucleoside-diphosphate-sugar epimerase